MGYDLSRFTEPIVDDFLCPICHDVMENAVESANCQHLFCDECIKRWLAINSKCPVDNLSLKCEQIKPVNRILRNLMLKLKIKCEFEIQGCKAVVTLESLKSHVESCLYDPNLKVKCEKECGLMIAQSEHKHHRCVANLSRLVTKLLEENLSLKEKISELQSTQLWICSKELSVNNNNSIDCQTVGEGFAQSRFSLTTLNSYFEVKVVDLGEAKIASIGVTNKCLTEIGNNAPKNDLKYILFFSSDGCLTSYVTGRKNEKVGAKWDVGDRIRCGIDYQKCTNHQSDGVFVVYFKRNDEFVCEKSVNLSDVTVYPTVFLKSLAANLTVI